MEVYFMQRKCMCKGPEVRRRGVRKGRRPCMEHRKQGRVVSDGKSYSAGITHCLGFYLG